MNQLQVFNYQEKEIRTVDKKGEIWWVLKDVCDILGLGSPHKIAERLEEDEKGRNLIPTPGGKQEMVCINESGLYNVILRSDKPEAKPFRKWVTGEVLPSIRKHGSYSITPDKQQRSEAMLRNAKSREAALWLKISEQVTVPEYKQICASYASGVLAGGEPVLPLPELEEHYLTATKVGELLGVSANRIGKLANRHHLKCEPYGKWFLDKAAHSVKEVETFRYSERGLEKLEELLREENKQLH